MFCFTVIHFKKRNYSLNSYNLYVETDVNKNYGTTGNEVETREKYEKTWLERKKVRFF